MLFRNLETMHDTKLTSEFCENKKWIYLSRCNNAECGCCVGGNTNSFPRGFAHTGPRLTSLEYESHPFISHIIHQQNTINFPC